MKTEADEQRRLGFFSLCLILPLMSPFVSILRSALGDLPPMVVNPLDLLHPKQDIVICAG